jgi:hypothetical protein
MKRLVQAPNVAIATLWADLLRTQGGIATSVQRAYASGIAGEIPPDQALPEVWVLDDAQWPAAQALLRELQGPAAGGTWACPGCGEVIEAAFGQCWNCGATVPERPR